jgi:hypothetical protein
MDKVVGTASEAVQDIGNGASLVVGGFGLCSIPSALIEALLANGATDLVTARNTPYIVSKYTQIGLATSFKGVYLRSMIRDFICGGKGIRTPDPLHAMQVLYQLSYTPGAADFHRSSRRELNSWQ